MQSVLDDGKKRMAGAITALEKEFGKLRTGRATTTLVDGIIVDYYGTPTPISQLASVSVPDPKTITIQPWDKGAFGSVEKAIQISDLGLNPVNDGKIIRIAIPTLTEERRKDLVKIAKKYTEKGKEISEDEKKKGETDVQKATDTFVKKCDETFAEKEKEILEI